MLSLNLLRFVKQTENEHRFTTKSPKTADLDLFSTYEVTLEEMY